MAASPVRPIWPPSRPIIDLPPTASGLGRVALLANDVKQHRRSHGSDAVPADDDARDVRILSRRRPRRVSPRRGSAGVAVVSVSDHLRAGTGIVPHLPFEMQFGPQVKAQMQVRHDAPSPGWR